MLLLVKHSSAEPTVEVHLASKKHQSNFSSYISDHFWCKPCTVRICYSFRCEKRVRLCYFCDKRVVFVSGSRRVRCTP